MDDEHERESERLDVVDERSKSRPVATDRHESVDGLDGSRRQQVGTVGQRDPRPQRQREDGDVQGRPGRRVARDGHVGEVEPRQGLVVHGDHARADLGEGGQGRRERDVVARRRAGGVVVGKGRRGRDDEVGQFDVGQGRGRGLRGRQLAVVAREEGEGRGVVGVHVRFDADLDRVGGGVSWV